MFTLRISLREHVFRFFNPGVRVIALLFHATNAQVKGYMWVGVWYFMFCFDQVRGPPNNESLRRSVSLAFSLFNRYA
jgi:hypothetical protein